MSARHPTSACVPPIGLVGGAGASQSIADDVTSAAPVPRYDFGTDEADAAREGIAEVARALSPYQRVQVYEWEGSATLILAESHEAVEVGLGVQLAHVDGGWGWDGDERVPHAPQLARLIADALNECIDHAEKHEDPHPLAFLYETPSQGDTDG